MSMLFADRHRLSRTRGGAADHEHQSSSGLRPLDWLLAGSETARQRTTLREIADDPHLLRDLGLTREDALELASRPFWPDRSLK